ncbi:MAG: CDP-alcohol phosphatidyltransferase family protein [Dehalococcoidia bacterium]
MISRLRPTVGRFLSEAPARLLAALRVTPNALTLIGLAFNIFTAWVLAADFSHHLLIGGILVLFSGWFDMLDGALARLTGGITRFGGMLDSTVDRFSEAALFLGLTVFFANRGDTLEVALIVAALAGSLMVSYTRARAEGMGFKGEAGIFARPERLVLLTLGLLFSEISLVSVVVVLWILAVGANLTAVHRLIYAWRQSKSGE